MIIKDFSWDPYIYLESRVTRGRGHGIVELLIHFPEGQLSKRPGDKNSVQVSHMDGQGHKYLGHVLKAFSKELGLEPPLQ